MKQLEKILQEIAERLYPDSFQDFSVKLRLRL